MATPGSSREYFKDFGFSPFLSDYSFHNNIMIKRDNFDDLNFTYPMNIATPNRMGLFGKISLKLEKLIKGSVDISSMKEARPVAAPNINKRSFLRAAGEIDLLLSEFTEILLVPDIDGFLIFENNTREDFVGTANTVDANNLVITNRNEEENCIINCWGVNLIFRIMEKVSILGIYQQYSIKGIKTIDGYISNQPIYISGYITRDFNIQNTIQGGGVIYAFSRNIKIQVDYLVKELSNKTKNLSSNTELNEQYKIDNVRALFTMKF